MNIFKILLCLNSIFSFAHAEEALEKATREVNEFLANNEVIEKRFYCIAGKLDCRTHYLLKHKDGVVAQGFYITFVSADRQLGGTGYFLPTEESGMYKRYEDFNFDGKKIITEIHEPVRIHKDHMGWPSQFVNIKVPRLGTSLYTISNIHISEETVVIDGIEYDQNNPDYKKEIRTQYERKFL